MENFTIDKLKQELCNTETVLSEDDLYQIKRMLKNTYDSGYKKGRFDPALSFAELKEYRKIDNVNVIRFKSCNTDDCSRTIVKVLKSSPITEIYLGVHPNKGGEVWILLVDRDPSVGRENYYLYDNCSMHLRGHEGRTSEVREAFWAIFESGAQLHYLTEPVPDSYDTPIEYIVEYFERSEKKHLTKNNFRDYIAYLSEYYSANESMDLFLVREWGDSIVPKSTFRENQLWLEYHIDKSLLVRIIYSRRSGNVDIFLLIKNELQSATKNICLTANIGNNTCYGGTSDETIILIQDLVGNGHNSGFQRLGIGRLLVNTLFEFVTHYFPDVNRYTGKLSNVDDPEQEDEALKANEGRKLFWESFNLSLIDEKGVTYINTPASKVSIQKEGLLFHKWDSYIPLKLFNETEPKINFSTFST